MDMDPLTFLDEKREEMIAFAQELIRINSCNSNETAVAEAVKQRLEEYGIQSEHFGEDPQRQNIKFRIGSPGKTLMLNGHLDTVPTGDPEKWDHPPFEPRVHEGKLYGRGATDMKGAVAVMTYVAIALKDHPLKGSLLFLFNKNEEGDGTRRGAQEAVNYGVTADACIITDNSEEKLFLGSRGSARIKVTTRGEAAHTGSALHEGKGVNAVLKMCAVLQALERTEMQYTPHSLFPGPKLTVGTVVSGGEAVNIVPERCEALVDARLVLGQTDKRIKNDLLTQLGPLKEQDPQLNVDVEVLRWSPAFLTDDHHPVIPIIQKHARTICGRELDIATTGGGTDGNDFSPAGIPCVVLGHVGGSMHTENEWVDIDSLMRTAKMATLTAMDFLS